MPKQQPARIPLPHEECAEELERLGDECVKVTRLATDLLVAVRAHPQLVHRDDVSLFRESRRDVEHARIVLEGFARRWGLEPEKGGAR